MFKVLLIAALLPALYALVLFGWPDLLRVVQGVRHVRGTVVRHDLSTDGFVPVFQFLNGTVTHEVRGRTASINPQPPVGSVHWLSHPRRRPDLARLPDTFPRTMMYGLLAAWLALFSDMAFDWL
ncbi:hypothetical protein [Alteraurantiacibacter palmitatis]|uniref:DUF3592 domain-containing protein n=1 Tax=Alteraurantiacibacter palmitatis TaxID=2054628 RepID=A0ABV7E3Q3_9SPHN